MNLDPDTTHAASEGLSLFAKAVSMLFAFVAGIVSATAVVVNKVSGYDARIKSLEEKSREERDQLMKKFDRLHSRIDAILLGKYEDDYRHEARKDDDQ